MHLSTLSMRAAVLATVVTLQSGADAKAKPTIPTLPLAIAVALEEGLAGQVPVRDEAWIDAQFQAATRLFGAEGVHFQRVERAPLDPRFARLETRDDRDALAAETQKAVVNVFVVASLRDVDDPALHRGGVHWRARQSPARHYIIVAASAGPSTLAHELGHFFGNGHSTVTDNVMSYKRTGENVFFDAAQVTRIRASTLGYLARKELVPIAAP